MSDEHFCIYSREWIFRFAVQASGTPRRRYKLTCKPGGTSDHMLAISSAASPLDSSSFFVLAAARVPSSATPFTPVSRRVSSLCFLLIPTPDAMNRTTVNSCRDRGFQRETCIKELRISVLASVYVFDIRHFSFIIYIADASFSSSNVTDGRFSAKTEVLFDSTKRAPDFSARNFQTFNRSNQSGELVSM